MEFARTHWPISPASISRLYVIAIVEFFYCNIKRPENFRVTLLSQMPRLQAVRRSLSAARHPGRRPQPAGLLCHDGLPCLAVVSEAAVDPVAEGKGVVHGQRDERGEEVPGLAAPSSLCRPDQTDRPIKPNAGRLSS